MEIYRLPDIIRLVAVKLDVAPSTVRTALTRTGLTKVRREAEIRQCAEKLGWGKRQLQPAALDKRNSLSSTLPHTLGAEGYLMLLEAYAGCRLYVPAHLYIRESSVPDAITLEHAVTLSEHLGGEYIKVPLDREFRAMQYFTAGMTVREVAIRLGLTEQGCSRLKQRIRNKYGNFARS